MKNSGFLNYLFLNVGADGEFNSEHIQSVLDVYNGLSEITKNNMRGMPTPFKHVIPISGDFFEFVKNSFILEKGFTSFLSNYHLFAEKRSVVLTLTPEEFKNYLGRFEESLKTAKEKLVHNLNEICGNLDKVQKLKEVVKLGN